MLQIVWNWMLVAVFPLLAGLLFRWLLRRWRRGWLLTAGAAALALILFLWASTIPIPGSEGPMLWTIQAACLLTAPPADASFPSGHTAAA